MRDFRLGNRKLKAWVVRHKLVYDTVYTWRNIGLRFLQLASGGTIFMLLILAALDIRAHLSRNVFSNDLQHLCATLRDPQGMFVHNLTHS
jgi:hypothetical protein